jgi:hypothetical protein
VTALATPSAGCPPPSAKTSGPAGHTAEHRLIQSFLLRAVGDNPVTEISEADVRNVAEVVREAADPAARAVSRALEDLVRRGERSTAEVKEALQHAAPQEGPVREWVDRMLRTLSGSDVTVARLVGEQTSFDERFIEGIGRARRELPNALKAAEFDAHRNLHYASMWLAVAEAVIIGFAGGAVAKPTPKAFDPLSAMVGFGLLMVLPRGTKSLTDAIVGLGARLKK